jgi:hypothetical protein
MQNVATGLYAAASSSGSIYFALNFGDEGKFKPLFPSLNYGDLIDDGYQATLLSALGYTEPASYKERNRSMFLSFGIGVVD